MRTQGKILRGEHLHEKNDKTAGGYVPVTAIVDESCRLRVGVGHGTENRRRFRMEEIVTD